MMFQRLIGGLVGMVLFAVAGTANAALIIYNDVLLGSGLSVSSGGVTMSATTSGGALGNITAGIFTGLRIGVDDPAGSYALNFSTAIDSIQIEFDALTAFAILGNPETITNFATSNGPITITYTNQFETSFDGTTITSISPVSGDGQGIIDFAGPAFTSFLFDHAQGAQAGFVIERIVINTASVTQRIPEPGTFGILLIGLVGLGYMARRRKLS